MTEIVGFIALGLVAATIAAALGVGGGVIYVPVLVVAFGFEQHLAQGTSLAIVFPAAVIATVAHARHGNVRWRLAVPIAVGGVSAALLAAWLAIGLDPEVLRRIFGAFLLAVAARMGWRAYRLNARSEPAPGPSSKTHASPPDP